LPTLNTRLCGHCKRFCKKKLHYGVLHPALGCAI
jgi:hypothetical protein